MICRCVGNVDPIVEAHDLLRKPRVSVCTVVISCRQHLYVHRAEDRSQVH